MELKFDDLFKATVLSMRINRCHPQIKRDPKWLRQLIVYHGPYTILFIIALQNIFLNLKEINITGICTSGIIVVLYIVTTLQYSVLVWRQTIVSGLMEHMKRDFMKSKHLTCIEQDIVRKYAMMGRYVCYQWLVLTVVGTSLFPIKNCIMIIYGWSRGEFHYIPLFDLVYPSVFVEENKDTLFIYVMTYIPVLWFAFYSSTLYLAFVPLGPALMLHACGQLEIMRTRVEVLFKNDDVEEIKNQLNDIVRNLQNIYGFVDRSKLCFRVAYEVTMKGTTIIVPISCYELFQSLKRGELSLDIVVFVVGGILITSAPCYYSDLLMEKLEKGLIGKGRYGLIKMTMIKKGEDLCQAIYFCGWERLHDRSIRSTLLVMLQRAQRPVAIQSLFQIVCLEALTDVFKQAFTIFNLLNASTN